MGAGRRESIIHLVQWLTLIVRQGGPNRIDFIEDGDARRHGA